MTVNAHHDSACGDLPPKAPPADGTAPNHTPVSGAVPVAPHLKGFDNGGYLIQRLGGGRSRVIHRTFDRAAQEAERLLALKPTATFIVMRQIARIKMKPVDPPTPEGRREASLKYASPAIAQPDYARLGIDDPEGRN